MATIYTVDYTDKSVDLTNKQPITILQGEWNNSTSLTLPGQAASLYGEKIAENFVHLLENFASETQPVNPTVGQLWYVPSLGALKVLLSITTVGQVKTYNWRVVGAISTTPTAPDDKSSLWYDTSNANPAQWQLKIYNTGLNAWTSVADRYVLKAGDTMTGVLKVGAREVGLVSNAPVNGFTSGFYPGFNLDDTHIRGANSVAVLFAGSGTASKQFVLSTASNPAAADDLTKVVLTAQQNGTVKIYRGTLDMSGNKIIGVANGSTTLDAVNFGQLSAQGTSLQTQITNGLADLDNRKVNRIGDTMTGGLTINGNSGGMVINSPGSLFPNVGYFGLTVNSPSNGQGMIISGADITNNANAINVVNPYGTGGVYQSLFNVKSFTGDTAIHGNVAMDKNLRVSGTFQLNSMGTMEVPVTSITYARHLVTKEYVDTKIAAIVPTEQYARVNPAAPRNGDILVSGSNTYIYNGGWNQVFPAQWAG